MLFKKQLSKDIYAEWLGIPVGHRPPDHYTLLGLKLFESDRVLIDQAATKRALFLRTKALKFPEEATQLLNEIAKAKICLSDVETRGAYDQSLRRTELELGPQIGQETATDESVNSDLVDFATLLTELGIEPEEIDKTLPRMGPPAYTGSSERYEERDEFEWEYTGNSWLGRLVYLSILWIEDNRELSLAWGVGAIITTIVLALLLLL